MTERPLPQRARPARWALWFVTVVAALAGAALATAQPAGAALSPGCTELTLDAQGLHGIESFLNSFQAGERLTFQAGPPIPGATPPLMGVLGGGPAGTTINLLTPFPGTLVFDFPLTGLYFVQLFTGDVSTWNVTCGPPEPPPSIPAREFGIPRVILCSPTLAMRADGTMGHAFDVEFREWKADPSYLPAGVVPARYYEGVGLDCSNLPGYTDAGRKTDGLGTDFGSLTPIVEGAVYPYFKKS